MRIAIAFFVFICTIHAHKYHFTTAEIEWNEKGKCFEVGLRVDSLDLEKALSLTTKKEKVDLDTTKNVDKYIVAYIKKNFFVTDRNKKDCPIHWVGKEVEVKETWLFFEVKVASGQIEGTQFENRFFFEIPPLEAHAIHDQINLLNVRWGEKTKSLYVNKYKAKATLSFQKNK